MPFFNNIRAFLFLQIARQVHLSGAKFRYLTLNIWTLLVITLTTPLLLTCDNNVTDADTTLLKQAGPILFISDKTGTSQLYSMDESGLNIKQLTNDPSFPIYDAKWSPDGEKIAVVTHMGDSLVYPGFRKIIFILSTDAESNTQLTTQWVTINDPEAGPVEYGGADNPVWSPDSKKLAYNRLMVPEMFGNFDIFITDLSTYNEQRLTNTRNITETITDWANDGSKLLGDSFNYSTTDSTGRLIANASVIIFDLEGTPLRSYGELGITYSWPRWSNTDSVIAFNSHDWITQDIYLIHSPDSTKTKLTDGSHQYTFPVSWSLDDKWFLYNTGNGKNKMGEPFGTILKINITTKKIVDLTPFSSNVYSYATSWKGR